MLRHNHYDAAFEAFLRSRRMPYVAVDEVQRALLAEGSLKSPDFLVYQPPRGLAPFETAEPSEGISSNDPRNWVVDVKGRQWTSKVGTGRTWENWATQDDIDSLTTWQSVFGANFRAALVFAYEFPTLPEPDSAQVSPRAARRWPDSPLFPFRGRQYRFFGVWVDDYRREMKTRSPRWETVWLPAEPFRRLRFSLNDLLAIPEAGALCGI